MAIIFLEFPVRSNTVSHVLLSCYILGAEGVHFGNVPVENKSNWPIFIHNGSSHHDTALA